MSITRPGKRAKAVRRAAGIHTESARPLRSRLSMAVSHNIDSEGLAGWLHDIANCLANIDRSWVLIDGDEIDAATRLAIGRIARKELGFAKQLLVDLTRLTQQARPQRAIVNLNTLSSAHVDLLRDWTRYTGVRLKGVYSKVPALVRGEKSTYKRVVHNLLLNALQATPRGGRIILRTARLRDHVELVIADSGRGIPTSELRRIVKGQISVKPDGSGRGLMLTTALVAQQAGTISVKSTLGQGTVFTLRFPAA